jgi:hypothetical protein
VLYVVTSEPSEPSVEGQQAGAMATGQGQQVRVGDLPVSRERRDVGVGDRDVVHEEPVTGDLGSDPITARAASTPIGAGNTLGFADTRTNPLSVTGRVAQPSRALGPNQPRMAA